MCAMNELMLRQVRACRKTLYALVALVFFGPLVHTLMPFKIGLVGKQLAAALDRADKLARLIMHAGVLD